MKTEYIEQLAKDHYNQFYGELRSPIENIEFSIKTEAYARGYTNAYQQSQLLEVQLKDVKQDFASLKEQLAAKEKELSEVKEDLKQAIYNLGLIEQRYTGIPSSAKHCIDKYYSK